MTDPNATRKLAVKYAVDRARRNPATAQRLATALAATIDRFDEKERSSIDPDEFLKPW